ncbi:DUF3306 domain-containing protein [Azospirillum sp. 11R-A]|uniref:DUF3306 domain-containing protein n=1 Tax=Azospirillum sp. 11R-A TaxID=3111634 RepID=UPI003C153C08
MAERGEEGFLGRWSRLKRDQRVEEPVLEPAEELPEALLPEPVPPESSPGETGEEVADLPSLDSLGSDSDYTGFLRREVPADLRREALRRAWASDPVIAGFRGFAEYDWDYNAPGYGALRPTDDIARLLNAVLPDEKREEEEAVETLAVADAEILTEPPQPPTADGLEGPPVDASDREPAPSPPRGED